MNICLFPNDKSQCKASADEDLLLLVPPYRSSDAIFLRNNDIPDSKGYCFQSWDQVKQFLHYQAAQKAAINVYPMITRSMMDNSSVKTPEKAHKHFLKSVISSLSQSSPTNATSIEVGILRLVYGEEKVSRSSLLKRYSWMENSSDPIIHQILIESGHEPFNYKSWAEITLHEVALSWLKNQQYEDIVHWCMFAMIYYDFEFPNEILEKIKQLYENAFKQQQKKMFFEAGGHKREPWQKKIKTRR